MAISGIGPLAPPPPAVRPGEQPAPDTVEQEQDAATEPEPLSEEAPAAGTVEQDPAPEPDPVSEQSAASRDVEQDADDGEAGPGRRVDVTA